MFKLIKATFFIPECQSVYLGNNVDPKKFPSKKDALLDTFQILIRAGIREGINDLLKRQNNASNITNISFEIGISIKNAENRKDGGGYGDGGNETEKYQNDGSIEMKEMSKHGNLGKLKVTSLQLALLARQTSSVEAILARQIESVATEDDKQEQKIMKNVAEKCMEVLGGKISLQSEDGNNGLFDIYDNIILGMNVFHLSSHFHPDGLQKILQMINGLPQAAKKIIGPKVTQLLRDVNNRALNYTPLHIATKKSDLGSVR